MSCCQICLKAPRRHQLCFLSLRLDELLMSGVQHLYVTPRQMVPHFHFGRPLVWDHLGQIMVNEQSYMAGLYPSLPWLICNPIRLRVMGMDTYESVWHLVYQLCVASPPFSWVIFHILLPIHSLLITSHHDWPSLHVNIQRFAHHRAWPVPWSVFKPAVLWLFTSITITSFNQD